jgi:hypothetical protein
VSFKATPLRTVRFFKTDRNFFHHKTAGEWVRLLYR